MNQIDEKLDPSSLASLNEEQSRLINPNLGHPLVIHTENAINGKGFEIELLFVSNIKNAEEFENSLRSKIELVPIYEYKWELLQKLEKERIEKELLKKKRGFWSKLKSRFSRKKRKEKKAEKESAESELDDEDFEKLKHKIIRGEGLKTIILRVEPQGLRSIESIKFNSYTSPREYLLKYEVFPELNRFYKVAVQFEMSDIILNCLEEKRFVMFDITHLNNGGNQEEDDRINYHSLVISNNEWKNFSFIHATDLHLADRNDSIYEIVKNWTNVFNTEWIKDIVTGNVSKDKTRKKYINTKKERSDETYKPLHKRYINPNNNFRNFIKIVNDKVQNNELDFVIFTGDLIDFSVLSTISQDMRKFLNFDYDQSNWRIFKEIVVNLPQKRRRGMVTGEEILCPVFTIPGNHDYRPYHYDFRWGGLYRKIGLNAGEALALNDKFVANPITSITRSFKALIGYLSDINSSLDYTLRLGDNLFIFLDTGSDSFRKLRDFISGHPSLTGLSNNQIKYLENIIHYKIKEEDNVFLLVHGPPINPKIGINPFKLFGKKKITESFNPQLDDLRESIVNIKGKELSDARIDTIANVKYGAISSNWEKIILFCKNYTKMTLSGHTHAQKEFRLADLEENEIVEKGKKNKSPSAIYYDNYSDIYDNPQDIEQNGPYVLQTPALGLGGYRNPNFAGGYREVKITDNKIESFKVKFISR